MGGTRTSVWYSLVMGLTTRALVPGAVAVALAACVHSPPRTAALTPTALIATAESRNGQTVTVAGYFTWRTDTRALWENRDAWLDAAQERKGASFDYWARCVTIYQASASPKRLSDRLVRVTGRVVILPENTLWACNRVAISDAVIQAE